MLYTSQSGVSKQIKDLEDELGVDIFIRRGKRLTGLTEPGKAVHQLIERMLLDAENLRRVARQFADQDSGHLVVATTHTQARYALPKVIRQFTTVFPKVHLALRQGSPQQIAQMIINGEADIGISTEALDRFPDIVTFPCYSWHHVVVVPKDHPLVGRPNLTLGGDRGVSDHYLRSGFHGRSHIDQAFAKAGALPDVVLTAIDADVIKTYVELWHGDRAWVAAMAYDPKRDTELVALDTEHLFEASTTRLGLRKGHVPACLRVPADRNVCAAVERSGNRRAAARNHVTSPGVPHRVFARCFAALRARCMSLTLASMKRSTSSAISIPAAASDGLPRIAVLATGGTIAGAAPDAANTSSYQAGVVGVDALLAAVPGRCPPPRGFTGSRLPPSTARTWSCRSGPRSRNG